MPGPLGETPRPHSPQHSEGALDLMVSKEQIFKGRNFLITGGSSGTGRLLVEESSALGAGITVVTRDRKKLDSLQLEVNPRINGIIGDFSIPGSGRLMAEDAIAGRMVPDVIVTAAAGGMEDTLRSVGSDVLRMMRPDVSEERKTKIKARIIEKIEEGRANGMEAAIRTNFTEQVAFLETLIPHLKPGSVIFDYSSLWSSIFKDHPDLVPNFYRIVAGTKSLMEQWFEENGQRLADMGIYTGIVSGHMIKDSLVGDGMRRFLLPSLSDDDRKTLLNGAIEKKDMVDATIDLLKTDPKTWGTYPKKLYVFGPGHQVADELKDDNPLFGVQFPI